MRAKLVGPSSTCYLNWHGPSGSLLVPVVLILGCPALPCKVSSLLAVETLHLGLVKPNSLFVGHGRTREISSVVGFKKALGGTIRHFRDPLLDTLMDTLLDTLLVCQLNRLIHLMRLRVAKGVIYPSNGMLHGKPTDPGFLKIQVDTVDDGWDEVIVSKPTDEVKTLKDTKGGQLIQWPRKYIKVLGRMSSNDSMSLPTSIPALTSPTTSAPVLCQMVIA
ncbi:hypothetical protein Tco_1087439 [Tanacetum coccineum]